MQFVFCTQIFTEKHVHFTTPDDVMAQILFKFLYCSFYDKKKKEYSKCSKSLNTLLFCFDKMLINAVAAQEHMLKKYFMSIYI